MKITSRRPVMFLLLVLCLSLFAACKGESPTDPGPIIPPGGGGGGNQGDAVITLTVSDSSPLAGATSTVSATVQIGGQQAPNGTVVEFSTTSGVFAETGTSTVARTTTNGVATVTLVSTAAGSATVTARIANVSRTAVVTFRAAPPPPPTPAQPPTISSVTPGTGRVAGGETVIITGTNFEAPVRVLFDGREAQVLSQTATEIRVLTPPIELGLSDPTRNVSVVVIVRAGTATEARAIAATTFQYQVEILTPAIYAVSPSSGPNEGNTQITIYGAGFQAPTQVFFGTGGGPGPLTNQVELRVIRVTPTQIVAETPPALGLGNELLNQQVTLRVLNVLTNRAGSLANAFRYGPRMIITAVAPTQGSVFGGTRVEIFGSGFDDPVAVTIGGVAAQVISVSGSKIVVITSGVATTACTDITGNIVVTNIEDGNTAVGGSFIYRVSPPTILSIFPSQVSPGATITISVANVGPGVSQIRLGAPANVTLSGTTAPGPDGISTFSFPIPSDITFPSVPCTNGAGVAGTRNGPVTIPISFVNSALPGCIDADNSITVLPSDTSCRTPPAGPPTVSGVSPNTGPVGTRVVITGTNFSGTRTVLFGDVSAQFTELSATQIVATVPVGATTGPVTVITASGGAAGPVFTVTTPPAITGFTPASAPVGNRVTVNGSGFTGATNVFFNGVAGTNLTVLPNSIDVTVPVGATTGPVTVVTPSGTVQSTTNFTVSP